MLQHDSISTRIRYFRHQLELDIDVTYKRVTTIVSQSVMMQMGRSKEFDMQTQKQSVIANGRHHHAASGAADKLRNQISCNHELSFLMEAHDGLSGAIAERAGFKGLWASGLSI
jgi:hypothetical protein